MNNTPKYLTIRNLMEMIERRDGKEALEIALDLPLFAGIHDDHRNFDQCSLFHNWPNITYPNADLGLDGHIRIDGHTSRKRLVEEKR